MASDIRKRDTLFPGSDPGNFEEDSNSSSKHNIPVPRITQEQVRRIHLKNGWPQSSGSTVSEKRSSREKPGSHLSDSGYKEGDKITGSKRTRIERRIGRSPRVTYHEFMDLDQAGPAVMGCDNTRQCNLVAIKRLKGVDKNSVCGMRPFTNDHVVSIEDMYFDNDDLVIVYEPMDISLRAVTSILQGRFKPFQIAAICKELIAGLSYIHEELQLYHGDLNCGTIILHLDGFVKIANVGESFAWSRKITTETRRDDIRSVGFVMMELMEPTTYMLSPHSTELQSPKKWEDSSGIKDFLRATQHQSLEGLKNHNFLPKESLTTCFRPHIFCALRAAQTNWDILSMP